MHRCVPGRGGQVFLGVQSPLGPPPKGGARLRHKTIGPKAQSCSFTDNAPQHHPPLATAFRCLHFKPLEFSMAFNIMNLPDNLRLAPPSPPSPSKYSSPTKKPIEYLSNVEEQDGCEETAPNAGTRLEIHNAILNLQADLGIKSHELNGRLKKLGDEIYELNPIFYTPPEERPVYWQIFRSVENEVRDLRVQTFNTFVEIYEVERKAMASYRELARRYNLASVEDKVAKECEEEISKEESEEDEDEEEGEEEGDIEEDYFSN